jgi:suppressor of ftsI
VLSLAGCLLACACGGCAAGPTQATKAPIHVRHVVAYDGRTLSIDGRRTALWVAEFHYWRMPSPDRWRDDFERMRDAGYNAVALDFYWGYHTPRPGVYDFSGVRDANRLLDIAAQERLYVIAQPGPYIGSGADADGLPDWLLTRTTRSGTIASRYARESRRWIGEIDAILARHQLTSGTGSVVLYEIGERNVAGTIPALERKIRADGVTIPFTSQRFLTVFAGVNWGWTGDPLRAYAPHDRVIDEEQRRRPQPIALPAISGWRSHEDDAEIQRVFEDQAWPPVSSALPRDADDPRTRIARPRGSRALDFLGVDDFGFHHGAVWYRGHFIASGAERAFSLRGITGRDGACGVWLNGSYLGSAAARDDGAIAATFAIAPPAIRRGMDNVISVLFENMGHNEDLDRNIGRAQPRGMLGATLSNASRTIDWHVLGNGEYNTDPVRGPLNSGGLAGEIAGWQAPAFADAAWPTTTLPARVSRAGVTWYRAHVALHLTPTRGAAVALRVDDETPSHYRALLYVNGWLMGHYISDARPTPVFAVPDGVLRTDGDNTIAIAVWSLDERSGLGRVSFTTTGDRDWHPTLPDVPEVRAVHGVARLYLDVAASGPGERPHFVYQGIDAAPTIRVHPGDTIAITMHNRLRPTNDTANAVNLHFHGLDVSPRRPGDDVLMTLARPGETLHYAVHVLRTQQPGLYWYHPHSHGETYWQVTSGMGGAIVVEGLQDSIPILRSMRERIIVVRDVQDVADIMAIPWYARQRTIGSTRTYSPSRNAATYRLDADDNPGPAEPCLAEIGLRPSVNDRLEPVIAIGLGERQFFRVLNATASRVLDLAIDNEQVGLVAVDGYPIGAYPGNAAVVWTDHVVVPPAGRAEFIAVGQSGPTLLRSRCYDSGPGGDRDPEVVLAQLESGDPTQAAAPAVPLDSTTHYSTVPGRAASISPGLPAVRRTIRLTEDARGFYIDGKAFAMDAPPAVVARAGTLEEWTVLNDTDEVHDFHIHQVHFLVESIDGVKTYPREWRDTVLVPVQSRRGTNAAPGIVRLLVDFRNPAIRGTFVFHCHMLDHEDGGMMATLKVI